MSIKQLPLFDNFKERGFLIVKVSSDVIGNNTKVYKARWYGWIAHGETPKKAIAKLLKLLEAQ